MLVYLFWRLLCIIFRNGMLCGFKKGVIRGQVAESIVFVYCVSGTVVILI